MSKCTIDQNDGTKRWHKDGVLRRGVLRRGVLHRDDGPAIESYNGTKEWWINGKLHRDDGPAIESYNGTKEWWIKGKEYTEEEFVLLQFTRGKIINE